MKLPAIIPARGGSKGIPRKNVLSLAGKPLIAYTIEACLGADAVSSVWVSTDDAEIAKVAGEYGARVIDRPQSLATDTASSEAALLHALDQIEAAGELGELFFFVQCTSPLTSSDDLNAAVLRFREKSADSLLSVTPNHQFLWKAGDCGAIPINHDAKLRLRRQDMEPQFAENGAFYLLKSGQFRKVKHRFFGRMELFPMHPSSATELDDPADIAILEGLLRRRTDTRDFPTVNDIDAIVFDFDGVFTNDLVSVDENGKESAVCSRSDGMGISLLKERFKGPILILSRETVPIVQHRAAKLKLECMHGKEDKLSVLKHWAMDKGIPLRRIAFVGNDVNDRECLKAVGYAFSPADGHGSILHEVDFILHNKGGEGAVREFCDRLLGATTAELNRINYDTN